MWGAVARAGAEGVVAWAVASAPAPGTLLTSSAAGPMVALERTRPLRNDCSTAQMLGPIGMDKDGAVRYSWRV